MTVSVMPVPTPVQYRPGDADSVPDPGETYVFGRGDTSPVGKTFVGR